ncbi:hypothetical protein NEF87_000708 [Candidatus Lokiarchaeum ossiferum]|uniref:DUF5714 domain-containing protein n=1 Tax=Candidatus Lokiarchaeum ossiferum TaxID=2951803 RepID=A0ABY6HLN5_9ARCH|nr:hypothetical protein NEF87_000708 [Candidatus Lokiarchaeum sp. B-35]
MKKSYFYDEFMQKALEYDNLKMEDYMHFMPKVLPLILAHTERDPVELFQTLMEELRELWDASEEIPFHGPWHHGIIPAVLLQTLQNNGDNILKEDIVEAYGRGLKITAGSCGFCGICGAGSGVGIALSIALKANPFQNHPRTSVFGASAQTIKKIGQLGGPRCCRLSSYVALEKGTEFLSKAGFTIEPRKLTGYCTIFERNAECHTIRCPYYSKNKSRIEE